jgi:hypothetical protein
MHKTSMNQHIQRMTWLQSAPALDQLTSTQLAKLAHALDKRTFHTGESIIKQGEASDGLYLIQVQHTTLCLSYCTKPWAVPHPEGGSGEHVPQAVNERTERYYGR